ncbi:MAG: MmcQ/YjbR family DNA-binding protein [Archangium sp.]|nr:MmcQ/YjbR family DNA-binding protein [Archangium sp.]
MAAKKKKKPAKKRSPMKQVREVALSYPGATEEFPWGESVIKVKGKVFVFLGRDEDDDVGFSVKLPHSGDAALGLPFCTPTGYGLGKSGWVSASFPGGKNVPLPLLLEWLDESYRAVAPKKLVATLPPHQRMV